MRTLIINRFKSLLRNDSGKTFRRKIINILCICMLLSVSLVLPQSLESEMERYLTLNNRLQMTADQEKSLQDRQSVLFSKKQRLEQKENWFNGWIINMQLAGINHALVQTADSLNTIELKVMSYRSEKERTLQSIKRHYEEYLSDISGVDSHTDRPELAREITGLLDIGAFDSFILPDYTELVGSLDNDDRLKSVILKDLSRLLTKKLEYVDSLLVVKKEDLKLYLALQDFFQDISLQSDADLEISTSGENEYSVQTPIDDFYNFGTGESMVQTPKSGSAMESAINQDNEDTIHRQNNIETDILRLQNKQQEYRTLLKRIRSELSIHVGGDH